MKKPLPEAQAYADALAESLATLTPGTASYIRAQKELAIMRRDHGCR